MISIFKENTVILFMGIMIVILTNIFTYQAVIELNWKISIMKERLIETELLLNKKLTTIEDFEALTKYNEVPKKR